MTKSHLFVVEACWYCRREQGALSNLDSRSCHATRLTTHSLNRLRTCKHHSVLHRNPYCLTPPCLGPHHFQPLLLETKLTIFNSILHTSFTTKYCNQQEKSYRSKHLYFKTTLQYYKKCVWNHSNTLIKNKANFTDSFFFFILWF